MRLALFALLPLSGFGQAPLPGSFLVTGASFEQKSNKASGWASYAVRLGMTSTYSYSTIEVTTNKSAVRTGLAQVLIRSGDFTILALGDGGVQTGGSDLKKSLSYGGVLDVDLSKRLLKWAVHLVVVIRPSTTGTGRVYQIGVGRSF